MDDDDAFDIPLPIKTLLRPTDGSHPSVGNQAMPPCLEMTEVAKATVAECSDEGCVATTRRAGDKDLESNSMHFSCGPHGQELTNRDADIQNDSALEAVSEPTDENSLNGQPTRKQRMLGRNRNGKPRFTKLSKDMPPEDVDLPQTGLEAKLAANHRCIFVFASMFGGGLALMLRELWVTHSTSSTSLTTKWKPQFSPSGPLSNNPRSPPLHSPLPSIPQPPRPPPSPPAPNPPVAHLAAIERSRAAMSTTFEGYAASRCVDDSLENFCHSNFGPQSDAWLSIELERASAVGFVQIYNRRDAKPERLGTFEICAYLNVPDPWPLY